MKSGNDDLLKEFSADQIDKLDEVIENYKDKPGGLIPVLEQAQGILEYLPVSAQKRIAKGLNLSPSQVFGVVTFYSFFTMTPRGKHVCRVCLGTACYVRGGKRIAENIEKTFGIKQGETTEDRLFTYEAVRCLGACGLAPVVVINDEVHGRMKPNNVGELLAQYD